jgi:eukaryotic-like serine/threonine-protein kinase
VLAHPGIVFTDPVRVAAHIQLGRSFAISGDAGDKAKAKAAYRDFLALWKDADSDIPMLNEARTEYAKLQ